MQVRRASIDCWASTNPFIPLVLVIIIVGKKQNTENEKMNLLITKLICGHIDHVIESSDPKNQFCFFQFSTKLVVQFCWNRKKTNWFFVLFNIWSGRTQKQKKTWFCFCFCWLYVAAWEGMSGTPLFLQFPWKGILIFRLNFYVRFCVAISLRGDPLLLSSWNTNAK